MGCPGVGLPVGALCQFRLSPFGDEPLELVDGDHPGAPWHLDGVDVRKDSPRECRRTDPECLSGLRSGVDEAHNPHPPYEEQQAAR